MNEGLDALVIVCCPSTTLAIGENPTGIISGPTPSTTSCPQRAVASLKLATKGLCYDYLEEGSFVSRIVNWCQDISGRFSWHVRRALDTAGMRLKARLSTEIKLIQTHGSCTAHPGIVNLLF